MEQWRAVWRKGIAPQLSMGGLQALRQALLTDDPRLLQGCTTSPTPLACVMDWPVEGACAVSLPGWLGDGFNLVGKCEEHFAKVCFECDQVLGEPGVIRHFLNWFDNSPREEMRRELLFEVDWELALRSGGEKHPLAVACRVGSDEAVTIAR